MSKIESVSRGCDLYNSVDSHVNIDQPHFKVKVFKLLLTCIHYILVLDSCSKSYIFVNVLTDSYIFTKFYS